MEEKKNIILLDDHVIIRNGLKALIEKLGPYTISQQFDNGADFLSSIPFHPEPQLIVMDINMPGMNGDEVIEKMNTLKIKIPVLVLTVNEDEGMIVKLFRMGVRGYLKKTCEAAELKTALNQIFFSGYYHNEFLTHSLQTNMDEKKKVDDTPVLIQLSLKEREFLKLVCDEKEYTYMEIAEIMGAHHSTIDGYRETLFNKFGIKSKTGLVLFVLRNKLFDYL